MSSFQWYESTKKVWFRKKRPEGEKINVFTLYLTSFFINWTEILYRNGLDARYSIYGRWVKGFKLDRNVKFYWLSDFIFKIIDEKS